MSRGRWAIFAAFVVRRRSVLGGALAGVLGLVSTIVAAILASKPSNGSSTAFSVMFVLISAFAQIAAALLFSRENAPNLKVFKNALTRQGHLWRDLTEIRQAAERAREESTLPQMRAQVGAISVGLSGAERDAERVIAEWASLLPDGSQFNSEPENLEKH